MRTLFCLFIFLSTLFYGATAQEATVGGIIRDKDTRETITGALVKINETGTQIYTDFDGAFSFPHLKAGNYTLSISFISYTTIPNQLIKIDTSDSVQLEIQLHKADLPQPAAETLISLDRFNPSVDAGSSVM